MQFVQFKTKANKKAANLSGPKFFERPHVTQGRFMDVKNLPQTSLKIHNFFFYKISKLFFVLVLRFMQRENAPN